MTIVPTPIPPADEGLYMFADPTTTDPLNAPSHSGLHSRVHTAVENLNIRVGVTEDSINDIWPQIDQARLAAHQWVVRGPLVEADNNKLLMPIIWNMTGRTVLFSAARATVYTPPQGRDLQVNIYTGHDLDGAILNTALASSILDAPLTIPAGQYTSPIATLAGGGFADNAFQAVNNYVVAVVTQVGTTVAGGDLTIQLNRLL